MRGCLGITPVYYQRANCQLKVSVPLFPLFPIFKIIHTVTGVITKNNAPPNKIILINNG